MMIKDPGRIQALLSLVEKVTTVSPGYSHIIGEAMAELRELNETIRKTKQAEQNQPVTPAPVGDKESPAPELPASEDGNPALSEHPTASTPTEASIGPGTEPPPVDKSFRKFGDK